MGFNSGFKGLKTPNVEVYPSILDTLNINVHFHIWNM